MNDDQHLPGLVTNIQHALEHATDNELLTVLQLLHSKLRNDSTDNGLSAYNGRHCLAAIGWDLLHPLFPIATQSIHDNKEEKASQLAVDLLWSIAQHGNPREIYMSLLERLGWITNDIEQVQSPSHDMEKTDDNDNSNKIEGKIYDKQARILDRCSKEIELAINLLIIGNTYDS